MSQDRASQRPGAEAAAVPDITAGPGGASAADLASRAHLGTGTLLTDFGARIGRPGRGDAPTGRRRLLPTAAPAAEPLPAAVRQALATLAAADPEAPARALALAGYAAVMARALAPAAATPIRRAALLCNLGLAALPAGLLRRAGALTPDERRLVRRHPILGAALLQGHPALADLIPPVLHHHEDYDGGGYPYGLSGAWIPLGARIIRVAETYDALLRPRPDRPALAPAEARALLREGAGRHFDPRCVEALVAGRQEGGADTPT